MNDIRKLLFSLFTVLTGFLATSIVSGIKTTAPADDQKPAIVFDLGGVLFDTDSSVVRNKQIGMYVATKYALSHCAFSGESIKNRWFTVLKEVQKNNGYSFSFHNEDGTPVVVKDEKGNALPDYMVEWMSGTRSNEAIYTEICEGIQALQSLSATDKKFMINLTKTFLPQQFVTSRKIIPQTVSLLKSLRKKGYPLYILSNWDKESFHHMMQTHPEIFALFDGYIVSGFVNLAKPDIRIYQELERQFPHRGYIFIDDQKDNITSARTCGWDALKVKTGALNKKQIKQTIAQLSLELHNKQYATL